VLDAAEAVFGEKGATASTEEVAERAGVGIATVFRHFPTKQALLEAIVRARLERLVEAGDAIVAAGAPDGFFSLFSLFLEQASKKRDFGDVLTYGRHHAANAALIDQIRAAYVTLISRGHAAGLLRPDFDARDVSVLLAGAQQSLQMIGDDPERRQRLLDMLMAGIRP
jgi:AcrR family transcriptional regulator